MNKYECYKLALKSLLMIKNLTTFILFLFTFSISAQQKYYEFGWNNHYGIVDEQGNEIIAPTYEWKSYTLGQESHFISLNSDYNGALIINTQTGKTEKFDYLKDTYLVDLDNKEYLYAYNEEGGFLLNNIDLDERISLPKKYKTVRKDGEYLTAFLDNHNLEFISIKDFEIKKSVKTQDIIQNFKTKKGNRIYVVHQRNSTLFLDDHLDKITSINKTLKGFKNIQSYLKRLNIEIIEEEYPTAVAIGGLSDYPVIRPKKEGEYSVFNLYTSKENFKPFFKFKEKGMRIYYSAEEMSVTLRTPQKLFVFFYAKADTKTLLLPKKYWKDFDLQLIDNGTL